MDSVVVAAARGSGDLDAARALLVAYYLLPDAWQGQGQTPVEHSLPDVLRAEADSLPGRFAPPKGEVLLARVDGRPVGVVLLGETLIAGTCEFKRLHVVESARGRGVARTLVTACLELASATGYQRVDLEVLPWRTPALRLYQSMGFTSVEAPAKNPYGLHYLRRELA